MSDKPHFALEFEKPLREMEARLAALQEMSREQKIDMSEEVAAIEAKILATKRDIYSKLTPWQKVQLARHPKRPYALDYIRVLCSDFQELHGDRSYGDDQALIGGTAFFDGRAVMIIAQQKGRETKENIRRNFGMPQPEGYRKALRLMKMADRFGMPILTFIDTPGAYPGIEAEARHVSEAIAVNLREMSELGVPVIATIVGEGGSGGALGIGVADRVLILEHAYYSVISPEGCAAILFKDRARAPEAAASLKLNAKELLGHGLVDDIIEEPLGGAHRNPAETTENVGEALRKHLAELVTQDSDTLRESRYQKYRNIGVYETV